ncbi:hypothetical protein WG31_01935 [Acetobacter oryzifermentans]|uniref:Tetratricopeptide repeat protein n=1 Tax=Acetobacter oryzifermentans TaxID=1633874 RepID=A0ABM6AH44_9PROT|nr:hypothetical protein WG31_01935 [Acetobacter oryzifermentans]
MGNFDFSISGKAGSEAAYIDAELGKGNIYTVISRVDKILKAYRKADGIECLKELIPYIDKAPAPQFANEEHCRKEALLTKARIFEKIGDYSSALRDYEAAAEIYSTKQTEKKIATIKKRISAI